MHHDRARTLVLSLFSLLLLASSAGGAFAAERGWTLRLSGVWVDPDLSLDQIDDDGERVRVDADSEIGFGLDAEYRFNRRFGLGLGYLSTSNDVGVSISDGLSTVSLADSVSFQPLTAGLTIHLTPDSRADLSVGVMAALVRYGDLRFTFEGESVTLAADDDFTWAAGLGLDLPLGDGGWLLSAAARYVDTVLDVTDDEGDRTALDFDPLVLSLGFGYRF